jgi:hypothetical protein
MKNKEESQLADKFGQITFGEESKLLIDIIGQNAILDLIPEKNREAYERILRRMYKGEIPYKGFASLQCFSEEFFRGIESNYKVSPLVITSLNKDLKSFIWDFSLYAKSNIILDKPKNKIVLYSLYVQAFHHIDSPENDPLKLIDFKVSEKDVLEFLKDSYKNIFNEIWQVIENKESFYKEINKQGEDYKQNIYNWRRETVYNPNWRTLVPVLDYLWKLGYFSFVHRLIGLYLRKNAQKAFAPVLGVSEDELKKIGIKIANMIRRKKHPEKIPSDLYYDDIWLHNQRINIDKCLEFQNNYENSNDVKQSNNFIEYLKRNYFRSSEEKFIFFWLQTRAKVFGKHSDLIGHKVTKVEILKGYREAFDELIKNGEKSGFLKQFLIEIMVINKYFNPRRKKAINDYYEYGCTLGEFHADNREDLFNRLKMFQNNDIRKTLVNIQNYFHLPWENLSAEKLFEYFSTKIAPLEIGIKTMENNTNFA